MADAIDKLPQSDIPASETRAAEEPPANRQRLLIVSPPASRARPVTNLANVFGRFAEMQQLVGDQVVVLEDAVQQQGQQLSDLSAQLPDMRERINWLIASYYEDDRNSQAVREQLARQEACLAALTDIVRGLCDAQAEWKHTLDQLMLILGRMRSPEVPAPPRWQE